MTKAAPRHGGEARRAVTPPPSLLTVAEAASYLRVCDKTVRKLVKTGALQHSLVGTQIRISVEAVKQYLGL